MCILQKNPINNTRINYGDDNELTIIKKNNQAL